MIYDRLCLIHCISCHCRVLLHPLDDGVGFVVALSTCLAEVAIAFGFFANGIVAKPSIEMKLGLSVALC